MDHLLGSPLRPGHVTLYRLGCSREPVLELHRDDAGHMRRGRLVVPADNLVRSPFDKLVDWLALLERGRLSELAIAGAKLPKTSKRLAYQAERHAVTLTVER